jgi:hypothetical protein
MKHRESAEELPSWLWLWFPPLIIVAQMLAKARSEEFYVHWMRSELGLVEVGTVLWLTTALAIAILLLLKQPSPRPPGFLPFVYVADPKAEAGAVTDVVLDHLAQGSDREHHLADSVPGEPPQLVIDERLTGDRQERFR